RAVGQMPAVEPQVRVHQLLRGSGISRGPDCRPAGDPEALAVTRYQHARQAPAGGGQVRDDATYRSACEDGRPRDDENVGTAPQLSGTAHPLAEPVDEADEQAIL